MRALAMIKAYLVDIRRGSDYGLSLFGTRNLGHKTLGSKLVANIHDCTSY